ncbi:hypothetical protein [Spirillospora sp. NPDC047279]|uniref:DUF7927 domain-containing protein n=1 Tax=Spirillospora sp. NPDC047279 TaxID=3155478 RepID=UPI00340FAFF6
MLSSFKGLTWAGVVTATALACTALGAGSASAAPARYATWDRAAGTFTVPGAPYLSGAFTSDASRQSVPSGNSSFLNEDTPFGREFGSSRGQEYFFFGTGPGKTPSTTTLTFDVPTPVGSWGFALGDIDADIAQIVAIGADGKRLTAAELGFQDAFNLCAGSPLPPTCRGTTGTDVPRWNAGSSSLVGNVTDTDGASGWFRPTVPIKELSVVFKWQSGIPTGQLWIAGLPHQADEPGPSGGPEIVMEKTGRPKKAKPGDIVHFAVKVSNIGNAEEPNAQFTDDLSDVLDDARYRHDAKGGAGEVDYFKPQLTWHGALGPGDTETITYSVKVRRPPTGDGKLRNVVIGSGPTMGCPGGKGKGCSPKPRVRIPKKYMNVCRQAVVPAAGAESFCAPVRTEKSRTEEY